ncbi:Stress responsive A/B Barrel Domain protein [bacterium YEK0313]|nr:Stress responsive A/B Barrel Domain protein [bacterium YEK0313]
MFHHVVLMSFKPGTGQDFFATAQHYVARVKAECADVVTYFLADNIASRSDGLTHGIVGVFTSSAAHDAYQVSAVHQEMKAFMATRMDRIVVLDTETGA